MTRELTKWNVNPVIKHFFLKNTKIKDVLSFYNLAEIGLLPSIFMMADRPGRITPAFSPASHTLLQLSSCYYYMNP